MRFIIFFYCTLSLFVLSFLSSCSKINDPPSVENIEEPNIYVTGYTIINGSLHAMYYKNGERIFLEKSGTGANFPTSIKVNNGDVYIGGIDLTSNPTKAILWRNELVERIIDETTENDRVYIDFFGENIHIFCSQNNNKNFAYYKDKVKLTSYTGDLKGFAVQGNDVYVCGWKKQNNAFYYSFILKNGVETNLSQADGLESEKVLDIAVANNNVYMAGFVKFDEKNIPTVWINEETNLLKTEYEGNALSVYVVGNDVYIAGYTTQTNNGVQHATYWKNGEKVVLDNTNKNSIIYDIVVSKSGKVYALGTKDDIGYATLWVDGKVDDEINGTKEDYIYYMYLEEK